MKRKICSLLLCFCIVFGGIFTANTATDFSLDCSAQTLSDQPMKTMLQYKTSSQQDKLLYELPQTLESDTEYTISIVTKSMIDKFDSENLFLSLYAIAQDTPVGEDTKTALEKTDSLIRSSIANASQFAIGKNNKYQNLKTYTFTLTQNEITGKKLYLGYTFKNGNGAEFYLSDFMLYKSSDTSKENLLDINKYTTSTAKWYDQYGVKNTSSKYIEYNPSYFKTALYFKYTGSGTKRVGFQVPSINKENGIIEKGVKYTISYDYYFITRGFDYGVRPVLWGSATGLSNPAHIRTITFGNYTRFNDVVGVKQSKSGKASYSFTLTESETLRDLYFIGFVLDKENGFTSTPEFYISNLTLTKEGSSENLLPENEYTTSLEGLNWKQNYGYILNKGEGLEECAYKPYGTGDGNIDGEFDIRDLVNVNQTVSKNEFNPFSDTNDDRKIDQKDIENMRYQLLGLGIVKREIPPEIAITKTASKTQSQTVHPGETVTYTINLENTTNEDKTVTVKDSVPTNTNLIDGCDTVNNGQMSWDVTVPSGETKNISYTVKVDENLELCNGSYINSTASANGETAECYNLYIERTAGTEDQRFISNGIRALKDSTYRDMELAKWIYYVAFTKSIVNYFPDTPKETLSNILNGNATDTTLDMVAPTLYGGKSVTGQITGIKGKPCNEVTTDNLIVGDILFVNTGKTVENYIYDKDGFVNLSDPLSQVDTTALLKSLSDNTMFAVFRPTINIQRDYIVGDLPELNLTPQQQAVIATAESYLLRGEKVQYADTRFGGNNSTEFRWTTGDLNPEYATNDKWDYINCAGFTYQTYRTALGIDIKYSSYTLNTTAYLEKYANSLGIRKYHYTRKENQEVDKETQQKIKSEILNTIEPGDLLVVRRSDSSGHVVLYIGNGTFIHSTGSVYKVSTGEEVYEPTTRYYRVEDYFFTEGSGGYIFYDSIKESTKQVTAFLVVRPLANEKYNVEVPTETQNRINNMQGVMAQKLCSHNSTTTANPGEEITYSFEVYNTNDKPVTLEICDTVPQNTTYISGAETVDGQNLYWNVTIPANTRNTFSYIVKVNNNATLGDSIQSTDSTVGGVNVICPKVYINRTLTVQEQNRIIETFNNIKTNGTANTGLALVNEIYNQSFGTNNVFADTDFLTVTEGTDGTFKITAQVNSNDYYTLNNGSKYHAMMVPTLYGGRFYYGTQRTDRTRLARPHNIMVGDVLIRRTSQEYQVYIYIGGDYFINITKGISTDTLNITRRLEYCLATQYYYAVYRPAFNMD